MFEDDLFEQCLEQVIMEGFFTKVKSKVAAARSANNQRYRSLTDEEKKELKSMGDKVKAKVIRIVSKYGFKDSYHAIGKLYDDEGEYVVGEVKDGNKDDDSISNFHNLIKEIEDFIPNDFTVDGDEYLISISFNRNSDRFKGTSSDDFNKLQEVGKKLKSKMPGLIEKNKDLMDNVYWEKGGKLKDDAYIIGTLNIDDTSTSSIVAANKAIKTLCKELEDDAEGLKVKYERNNILLTTKEKRKDLLNPFFLTHYFSYRKF